MYNQDLIHGTKTIQELETEFECLQSSLNTWGNSIPLWMHATNYSSFTCFDLKSVVFYNKVLFLKIQF
jgi:hypothetical protein